MHIKTVFSNILLLSLPFFILEAKDASAKKIRNPSHGYIVGSGDSLAKTASSALAFLLNDSIDEAKCIGKSMSGVNVTFQDVIDTLQYIEKINKEDLSYISIGKKFSDGSLWSSRLEKYWFLKKNFDFYKISGNQKAAKKRNVRLPSARVKITKYAFFDIDVRKKKSWKYNTAIYASPEWVNPKTGKKQYRHRFTKQDVFNGVFRKGGKASLKAKPLAFATHKDFENVMLQGTFVGKFSNGSRQLFAPTTSNDIAFKPGVKISKQKRYIYYKIQDGLYGYGKTQKDKIKIVPKVTFAGDVEQFGIGKFVYMFYQNQKTRKPQARFGILADTGGAFKKNPYQLDFLLGSFASKKGFYSLASQIPEFCEIYFLIKKK